MADSATRVTAVVLNYQREDLTAQCIEALERSTVPVRVLVVDNASPDGSGERLRARFSHHDFLQTGANLGYAGGNARGMAKAIADGAEFVLVINDDAEVARDTVQLLVEAMSANPRLAIAAPTIRYDDVARTICWAGGELDSMRALGTPTTASNAALATGGAARGSQRAAGSAVDVIPCSFVSGCCFLVRASVVQALGAFREEYFSYVEDVELSVRYARAGWRLGWVPPAEVLHHTPYPEPPITPWKIVRRDQNRRRLAAEHYRGLEFARFAAWFYATRAALLAWALLRGDLERARALVRGTFGALTGGAGASPAATSTPTA